MERAPEEGAAAEAEDRGRPEEDDAGEGEVQPLDLEHMGLPGAICCHLVLEPEPALVDPGPPTTLERLIAELETRGLSAGELRHLFLTHVHLDHAGATGHLVALNPDLAVHVHEDGAPHMVDPERLVASTRRTFGEAHDRLWGEVRPVPRERLRPWGPGDGPVRGGFRFLPSPGHIDHHLAFLHEASGTLLAGDAAGIILHPDAPSHPPTPPPGVDLAAWRGTLARLRDLDAERLGVAHFGLYGRVEDRLLQMEEKIDALERRVERALEEDDEEAGRSYDEEVRRELASFLSGERVNRYFDVFSARTDWAGARRYVERRGGG